MGETTFVAAFFKEYSVKEYIGLKGRMEYLVDMDKTAARVGSGALPVFATPWLVALMENAAVNALTGTLPEGSSTVGAAIEVQHTAATPLGMRVYAEAELTQAEGRRLQFSIKAYDEAEQIGEAAHTRFIVDVERFMKKAEAKKG